MMRTEISKGPNEMPIVCITIVLGLLSYMATFYVMVFQGGSLPFTYMAGIFCGRMRTIIGSGKSAECELDYTSHIGQAN